MTSKYWTVAALVADGLRNIDIAERIGVTEFAVKSYLTHIFDELGLWNRTELALWYVRQTFDKEKELEKTSILTADVRGAGCTSPKRAQRHA